MGAKLNGVALMEVIELFILTQNKTLQLSPMHRFVRFCHSRPLI